MKVDYNPEKREFTFLGHKGKFNSKEGMTPSLVFEKVYLAGTIFSLVFSFPCMVALSFFIPQTSITAIGFVSGIIMEIALVFLSILTFKVSRAVLYAHFKEINNYASDRRD